MKIFLIKFIRSTQGANMQDSGKNLETILQFYETIKTELSAIEEQTKKSLTEQNWLGMVNPAFYDIDHEIERLFIGELKKELYQPPTGFHAALQDQQT